MIQPESEWDKASKEQAFSIRIPYKAPCRLGNWNEELFLKEEKTLFVIYKRDRCQLLLQKTRKMFRNLSKPTNLSHCLQMLTYGENYQIKAPAIPYEYNTKVRPVYLAGVVTDAEIDAEQDLADGCLIVGCLDQTPRVRNTFRIVGCDRDKTGEPVKYGEDIYLQIVGSTEAPLYVHCENTFVQMGLHLIPRLTKCTNTYCRFKILHHIPKLRFEQEGTSIRANDTVVVQHVPSGRNLAVESSTMSTFFGNEHVVSCQTFKDTHRMETAENLWKIIGENLPDKNAVFWAAKGEDVPESFL